MRRARLRLRPSRSADQMPPRLAQALGNEHQVSGPGHLERLAASPISSACRRLSAIVSPLGNNVFARTPTCSQQCAHPLAGQGRDGHRTRRAHSLPAGPLCREPDSARDGRGIPARRATPKRRRPRQRSARATPMASTSSAVHPASRRCRLADRHAGRAQRDIDMVARGSRNIGDDCPLLPGYSVDKT